MADEVRFSATAITHTRFVTTCAYGMLGIYANCSSTHHPHWGYRKASTFIKSEKWVFICHMAAPGTRCANWFEIRLRLHKTHTKIHIRHLSFLSTNCNARFDVKWVGWVLYANTLPSSPFPIEYWITPDLRIRICFSCDNNSPILNRLKYTLSHAPHGMHTSHIRQYQWQNTRMI